MDPRTHAGLPLRSSEQVNTGNYRKAVELFRGLLSIRPGLVGAHLGLGSALALLGGMEHAVASFSAAIEVKKLVACGIRQFCVA